MLKIEEYFESEEALNELLVDYKEVFETLDDLSNQLRQGVITTSDDFKTLLNSATGYYGTLEPLYSLSIAVKENSELKAYADIKINIENGGGKFTSAPVEREASLAVAAYRRVRNILEAYVNVTEKLIVTAQTQLKRLENDIRFKPVEEK